MFVVLLALCSLSVERAEPVLSLSSIFPLESGDDGKDSSEPTRIGKKPALTLLCFYCFSLAAVLLNSDLRVFASFLSIAPPTCNIIQFHYDVTICVTSCQVAIAHKMLISVHRISYTSMTSRQTPDLYIPFHTQTTLSQAPDNTTLRCFSGARSALEHSSCACQWPTCRARGTLAQRLLS